MLPERLTKSGRVDPSHRPSNVLNGAVTISGKTATFKAGSCGLASWTATVKDGAGSTKSKDMVAFVDAAAGGTCP